MHDVNAQPDTYWHKSSNVSVYMEGGMMGGGGGKGLVQNGRNEPSEN